MLNFKLPQIILLLLISIAAATFTSSKINDKFLKPIGYGYKKSKSISTGEIPNFALLDHFGNFQELYRQTENENILIVSTDINCELFESLIENLSKIPKNNLKIFLFSINEHKYRNQMISISHKFKSDIPILIDTSHAINNLLKFNQVGDYLLIKKSNWKKVAEGNLIFETNSFSKKLFALNIKTNLIFKKCHCNIPARKFNSQISFEKTIAPILINKCLNCHSKQASIPPYFDSFQKIQNWRQMSKETLLTGRMPPVSFDPLYGDYANDISLTDEEKFYLINWLGQVNSTTTDKDPIKNYKPKQPNGVNPKELLYSAEMSSAHKIPPGGEVEYKYFQLGGPVPFDMWVKGYKTISSNPRQLHHESLMITSQPLNFYETRANKFFQKENIKDEINQNTDGDLVIFTLRALEKYEHKHNRDNYLRVQTWGAGRREENIYPNKIGAYIPKGSYLILETHYMGTGRTEFEKSKIEFYGTQTKPKDLYAMHSYSLVNSNFEVPPNTKNYEVRSHLWSPPRDVYLVSFLGHLHMRGQSVRLELTSEKGEKRTLISIPNFYYGWQTGSSLRPSKPILVKVTDQLQTVCHYDNSIHNPFNPDPNKRVRFGQRVDRSEMCKMNFGYVYK